MPMTRFTAIIALALAVGLAGCARDPGGDAGTVSPSSAPTDAGASPSSTATPTGTESSDPTANPDRLENGRHAAWLLEIDTAGRTLTVDVIQFLTGDEATAAYQSEFPGENEEPPNGFWIVNANPRLRTLSVADDVTVTLVRLLEDSDADSDPGTWDELEGYLLDYADTGEGRLSYNPFWLVVEEDVVVQIDEQYIP